jgi:O-antigen biosynthesis protein
MRVELEQPRLSLCMIVRDSARPLPACLESVCPWVDEMVVVDTGAVDETPRIVESFGGRLFHFPWCDDFSAARNESLRHARGDWLFWMDSDDTIPPECGRELRRIVGREVQQNVLGYIMQVHCPGGAEGGVPDYDVTMVDHWSVVRRPRSGAGDLVSKCDQGSDPTGWVADRPAVWTVLARGRACTSRSP